MLVLSPFRAVTSILFVVPGPTPVKRDSTSSNTPGLSFLEVIDYTLILLFLFVFFAIFAALLNTLTQNAYMCQIWLVFDYTVIP
jgi:hypothetical protein